MAATTAPPEVIAHSRLNGGDEAAWSAELGNIEVWVFLKNDAPERLLTPEMDTAILPRLRVFTNAMAADVGRLIEGCLIDE